MIIEGKATLPAPAPAVWATLLDVQELAACLAGVEDVHQIDGRTFEGAIRASVGPISGHFALRAQIVDAQPPRSLAVHVEGTDSVTRSTMTNDVTLTLTPLPSGDTELAHHATLEIKGRLALLGDMVLRATAAVMLDDFAKRLGERVASKAAPAPNP